MKSGNNTRIEAFYAFVIVESQLFTISIFYQNHAEKIMDFEHPTLKIGILPNLYTIYM